MGSLDDMFVLQNGTFAAPEMCGGLHADYEVPFNNVQDIPLRNDQLRNPTFWGWNRCKVEGYSQPPNSQTPKPRKPETYYTLHLAIILLSPNHSQKTCDPTLEPHNLKRASTQELFGTWGLNRSQGVSCWSPQCKDCGRLGSTLGFP